MSCVRFDGLVVDERWHVEMVSYSVASKLFVYMVTVRMRVFLDCFPDLGELNTGFTLLNADEHGFPRHLRQALDIRVYLWACWVGVIKHYHGGVVSMAAVLEAHNVEIHVVSGLEHVGVRHAMSNNIIDRSAETLREVHEVDC